MKIPKPKEKEIIVDGCTCGKSKLLMTMEEYFSDQTSDAELHGTMRAFGHAWVRLLNGYILKIDGTNSTLPYRRSATSIVKQTPLTEEQEGKRKKRLEYLAVSHPGLYELIRIVAKKEKIEPIKVPLKRVDILHKEKTLEGLQIEKERKRYRLEELDKDIDLAAEKLAASKGG